METVGKFEFNRKDLIGHGAFAVVFRGRHKKRHDFEVAVKCINKKNLAKSQSLLGKEIKILKELKHKNIVGLLDFQEISGCVYLVMEYCNGGDLAEYLQSKGSLREDTIRVFLQQIAGAMGVLRSKGIIHRDLKPQNILLAYSSSHKASPSNICIKIADFGFARYLQDNTMAATLCGSPMYMAPEVIMSQSYDAKADLWSVGTIVYQCLTGKAPFQASSPQELRLFYERNRNLTPSIPRETSHPLRHLLLGLLQRNYKDRMDFNEFFHHPFLEVNSTAKKSSPVPMPSYPSTGSGSSCSSSSPIHLTPTQSDAEPPRPLPLPSDPTSPDSLLNGSSMSEVEDFVMVPAQFTSEMACDTASLPADSLMQSSSYLLAVGAGAGRSPSSPPLHTPPSPTRPPESCCGMYGQSVPVPVPTQIHNYQRMKQNLHSSSRTALPIQLGCGKPRSVSPIPSGAATLHPHRLYAAGGGRPFQPSPQVGTIPEIPIQSSPLGTRTGVQRPDSAPLSNTQTNGSPTHLTDLGTDALVGNRKRTHQLSPDPIVPKCELRMRPGGHQSLGAGLLFPRTRTVPNLQQLEAGMGTVPTVPWHATDRRETVKRSFSTGRLSDMLLKAVFGAHLDRGSTNSLNMERPMEITGGVIGGQGCPSRALFTLGSPTSGPSPPQISRPRFFTGGSTSPGSPGWTGISSRQGEGCSFFPDVSIIPLWRGVAFEPPELPEDTLMEQDHTDTLDHLRFILAFSHCIMEISSTKGIGFEPSDAPDASFLEQSVVADQISLLSREWSYAEQLVLSMKSAELLSSALHCAMEAIKQGKLYASHTVKQVVRKLNEQYKSSVSASRWLSARLQLFFTTKQKLMDGINSITAEKLIYAHAVNMVQCTALDEMFHQGQATVERYHRALLLMEGLTLIITEPADISNIDRCKQCIMGRLSALQPGTYV